MPALRGRRDRRVWGGPRRPARGAWTLRTVAVILANPRYTGRQTWNRRAAGPEGPASRQRCPSRLRTRPSSLSRISSTRSKSGPRDRPPRARLAGSPSPT
ncbi:recombinase family protein [Amycolatopsis sp. RTGN1]|uniref:recombinase family protein n=1 Tax=Amycolatopsis ponsaeliensis TaxID=2992142 RepID=UPI00330705D6